MEPEEFHLRPVAEPDLPMLLAWRNSERVRAFMYTDHLIGEEEHRAWFQTVLRSDFPATLVFEYRGRPVGLKSFSRIDRRDNRCHWGFYLGEEGLPRGCASAMGFLALEYIFERHGFRKLCAEAFSFNEASIRYHTRLGFSEEGRFVKHTLKNGSYRDVISFAMFQDEWLRCKAALAAKIFRGDGSP